uniref:Uncharacterized protein n=1 Tax=Arundo donax TaxID=35708 RepID=A0A0A9A1Z2_ARUDO
MYHTTYTKIYLKHHKLERVTYCIRSQGMLPCQ